MESRQRSKYNMYMLLKAYLLTIAPAIFLLMPFFQAWFDEFVEALTQLTAYLNQQERHRLGYAVYKRNVRQILIDATVEMAASLTLFGTGTNKPILVATVNYKEGVLSKFSDAQLISAAEVVQQQAVLYVAELAPFNITVVSIALFGDKVSNFSDAQSQPKDEIYDKAQATIFIKTTIAVIDALLVNMDIAVRTIRKVEALFHLQYFQRRKIMEPLKKMLSARGNVTDEQGNPIPLVQMTCEDLGLNRKTSKKGGFTLKNVEDGEYLITFSRPGYQTIVVSVIIADGVRAEVNVTMVLHEALIPA